MLTIVYGGVPRDEQFDHAGTERLVCARKDFEFVDDGGHREGVVSWAEGHVEDCAVADYTLCGGCKD